MPGYLLILPHLVLHPPDRGHLALLPVLRGEGGAGECGGAAK